MGENEGLALGDSVGVVDELSLGDEVGDEVGEVVGEGDAEQVGLSVGEFVGVSLRLTDGEDVNVGVDVLGDISVCVCVRAAVWRRCWLRLWSCCRGMWGCMAGR